MFFQTFLTTNPAFSVLYSFSSQLFVSFICCVSLLLVESNVFLSDYSVESNFKLPEILNVKTILRFDFP